MYITDEQIKNCVFCYNGKKEVLKFADKDGRIKINKKNLLALFKERSLWTIANHSLTVEAYTKLRNFNNSLEAKYWDEYPAAEKKIARKVRKRFLKLFRKNKNRILALRDA